MEPLGPLHVGARQVKPCWPLSLAVADTAAEPLNTTGMAQSKCPWQAGASMALSPQTPNLNAPWMMGVIQHTHWQLVKARLGPAFAGCPGPVMRISHSRGSFDKAVVYVTPITDQADVAPCLVSNRGQITH